MPRALTKICHASRIKVGGTTSSSYVWISDDLLAQTFSAFVKTQRRHGSNVPGPLEARRRAAKRKTTTLAQIPSSHPDPAMVMSSVPQSGWWTPAVSAEKQAKPSFWPLFAGRSHEPPPPPSPTPFSLPAEGEETQKKRFYNVLDTIRTFDELMALLEHPSTSPEALSSKPTWHVLRSMIEHKWAHSEIEQFLLDPRTNPPGYELFRYTFRQALRHSTWMELARHLITTNVPMRAARLGLLGERDVMSIVFLITKEDKLLSDPHDFLHTLINDLEISKVTDMPSVCKPILFKLEQLMSVRFYQSTPRLMCRLAEHAQSKNAPSATLSETVLMCLNQISEGTGLKISSLINFILLQPSSQINKLLYQVTEKLVLQSQDSGLHDLSESSEKGHLDASMRAVLIANLEISGDSTFVNHISRIELERIFDDDEMSSINANSPYKSGQATPLQSWFAVLAGIGSHRDKPFVAEKRFFQDFLDRDSSIDQRGRILIGFWIATALSMRSNRSISTNRLHLTAQHVLHEYNRECRKQGEDLLASVVMEIRRLPLPAKNKLLRRMCSFSGGLMHVKVNYWQLLSLCMLVQKDQHYILRDKRLYKMIKTHFPTILERLCESFNSDLALFEKTARTIICETKGSAKLILRLLAHNTELKFALRHAANFMWTAPPSGNNLESERLADATNKAVGQYTYLDIVNMINNFAWDCARSEMLSPRLAFRFAWGMLMYLHMHRAPVLPTMLHAVWHSAVVRNPNISYTVVRLLYSYNLEYLGEDGAQQMLDGSNNPAAERLLASPPMRQAFISRGETVAEELLMGWAEKKVLPDGVDNHKGEGADFVPYVPTDDFEDFLEEGLVRSTDGEEQYTPLFSAGDE